MRRATNPGLRGSDIKRNGVSKNKTWIMMKRYKVIYLLLLFPIASFAVFNYAPLYGLLVAFKQYRPAQGIFGSAWVGFKWFEQFLTNPYFWRVFRNTVLLGFYNMVFGFPAPIIFALLLNEITRARYKKVVQTVTLLPHFLSMVAICSMIIGLLSPTYGAVNKMLAAFGIRPIYFMAEPGWFRTIFVATDIWQGIGFSSILYLAAIAGVDQEQYEAAMIDGANRFQRAWHITLSAIKPTICILLILSVPSLLRANFEKVLLLYNNATFEVADVISTYLYRLGLEQGQLEFSTAVGLFNAVLSFLLVLSSNKISKMLDNASLW